MKDLNTPVWQLTAGELIDFLVDYVKPAGTVGTFGTGNTKSKPEPESPAPYTANCVYGISGIAKLLGCSTTTVSKYRLQGWIEPAITQNGRKIICDAKLALELFDKRGGKK
jgi:hypothetical protein